MSEIRDGETLTAFTIRRIRDEIIEDCAKAVECESVSETGYPEDAAYNKAIIHAAEAVRALKDI